MKKDNFDDFITKFPKSCVCQIVEQKGSGPRSVGTWMLIAPTGDIFGTIGGGQLEYIAINRVINHCDEILAPQKLSVKLGSEIGQCCGGKIVLLFSPINERLTQLLRKKNYQTLMQYPNVLIFGAGNVGASIAIQMLHLPFKTLIIDTREQILSKLSEELDKCFSVIPEQQLRSAPPNSAYVIVTHDHSLDFLLAQEALERKDAAYIGVVGSKSKRAALKSFLTRRGDKGIDEINIPIGKNYYNTEDKRPEIIAIHTVVEIINRFSQSKIDRI